LVATVSPLASTGTATERAPGDLGLRERKKLETRTALISAALRLVEKNGFEGVTVEDISVAANVSVRTFFNYFRNKEDAVTGGGVITSERLTRVLHEAPPELSVLGAIRQAMLAEAEEIERDPAELTLVLGIAERTPSLMTLLIASWEEVVLTELAEAVGHRTGLDPAVHGYPSLIAAVSGAAFRHCIFRWHGDGQVQPLSELVSSAFDALATGLPVPD
jgi:AcrR family transcriptional regulator